MNDLESIYAAKVLNERLSLDSVDVSGYRLEDLYKVVKINEAKVNIEFADGNVQTVEMDDTEARKLMRLQQSEESPDLKKWAASAGWDTEAAQFALEGRLNSIYNESIQMDNKGVRNSFYKEVKTITSLKDTNKLDTLTNALQEGNTNFKKHIDKLGASRGFKFITNSDAVNKVAYITFEEGAVGVGPGEAVLTLFSEGKNPSEGDIALPNGQLVELKAGAGRPGKGKTLSLIRKFNDFTKGTQLTDPIDADAANAVLDGIVNFDFTKLPAAQIRVAERVIANINSNKDIESKIKSVYKDTKGKAYFDSIKAKDGKSINEYLAEFQDQIKQRNEKEGALSNRFFDSADKNTLLTGLLMFASQPQIVKPIIEKALNSVSNNQGEVARAIAAAMQINEYHNEEKDDQKFTWFTLFNKDNFNMLTFGPFSSDYAENANRTVQDMLANINEIGISPNTGGGRGGYNLTLK